MGKIRRPQIFEEFSSLLIMTERVSRWSQNKVFDVFLSIFSLSFAWNKPQ